MIGTNERALTEALEWLRTELSRADFGEVHLAFIVHGGRLARVEKTVVLKSQPADGNNHGANR